MKNNWIKKSLWLGMLGMFFIGVSACEKEEEVKAKDYVGFYAVKPNFYGSFSGDAHQDIIPLPGASVKVYRTEADYLLDKNVLKQGLTSAEGYLQFEMDADSAYWFRIEKGEFNNLRNKHYNTSLAKVMDRGWSGGEYWLNYVAIMSTTPTRLQLQVMHNGTPVQGAEVQLYFSEEDYLNNLPAQENYPELEKSYGLTKDADWSRLSFTNDVIKFFTETSDKDGYVLFDNLEPRQYWFRIKKDNLNNAGGTITNGKALPDDANLTTSLQIGIN